MDLQLKKKIALVSGGTAGIGHAIATSLAREGAAVIVNGRTEEAVDGAVAAMKKETGGDVRGFAGDLGLAAAADALIRGAVSAPGRATDQRRASRPRLMAACNSMADARMPRALPPSA
jgi:NAD(P)-dependent dehydrogenase (short-subunit alcohol dehydrogenase family)